MRGEELRTDDLPLSEESWLARCQVLLCGLLFVASAVMIWTGRGGWWSLVGIAVFLADLFLFLALTFQAVDQRVGRLNRPGARSSGP